MFFSRILCLGHIGLVIGFTPLKTLLTSRAVLSSIQKFVSTELIDEDNVFSSALLVHDISSFDSWALLVSLSSLCVFFYHTHKNNLYKWEDAYIIDRKVRLFLLVFLAIMFKNVPHAI
jgi:hypothetical protein